jgi:two-component system response regulator PilR (NtrC family)
VKEQLRRATNLRGYDMQTTAVNSERASILVVDDDESSRDPLAYCLRKQYICATAATAEEAMAVLEGRFFDVVMTDVDMPDASGLELCRHIRKTYPDTIVLVISARVDSRNRIKALQHGAFDYVSKPFDLKNVARLIDYALLPPSA